MITGVPNARPSENMERATLTNVGISEVESILGNIFHMKNTNPVNVAKMEIITDTTANISLIII